MNRDEKIAHTLRCMAGENGIPWPLSDLQRVVENAVKTVDEKWPAPERPTIDPNRLKNLHTVLQDYQGTLAWLVEAGKFSPNQIRNTHAVLDDLLQLVEELKK